MARIKKGENIEGRTIDFENTKLKALKAFELGKKGIKVPDDLIKYDDSDIAYDSDFDDYDWDRTDFDPILDLNQRITVNIEVDEELKEWIQKNNIQIDQLLQKLIHSFYSANQMIKDDRK